jgi:hypothetical protein
MKSLHMMNSNIVSSSAARQRRRYQRRKNGLIVLPTVCVEESVTAILRADGYLNGTDPTREELAEAFSSWVYQIILTRERFLFPDEVL